MALKGLMPFTRGARFDLSNPFESMRSLVETMERAIANPWSLSEAMRGNWTPEIEIEDGRKAYTVKARLPGMSKDDFEIDVTADTLTLKGRKSESRSEMRRHGRREESSSRSFCRSFTLPSAVKVSGVKASFKGETLIIELPKVKQSQLRRVEIK